MSDGLDPPLFARKLTPSELAARQRGVEIDRELEAVVRPRIAAQVSACRQALDAIEIELDRLTDTLSIDPAAETRAAALWLLLGRCVGQQRAVVLLAEHGMAAEGRPLDRTIKEISNLVKAIAAAGDPAEKLARQWLADDQKYVKAQAGRRGMTGLFHHPEREEQALRSVGITTLDAADKRVYDDLSRDAHGRRSALLKSYYAPTRHMARGGRYALLDQAIGVNWASSTTGGVALAAAAMLLPFRGQSYIERHTLSLYAAVQAVRETQPLEPEAIAREVGLSAYPYWPQP